MSNHEPDRKKICPPLFMAWWRRDNEAILREMTDRFYIELGKPHRDVRQSGPRVCVRVVTRDHHKGESRWLFLHDVPREVRSDDIVSMILEERKHPSR